MVPSPKEDDFSIGGHLAESRVVPNFLFQTCRQALGLTRECDTWLLEQQPKRNTNESQPRHQWRMGSSISYSKRGKDDECFAIDSDHFVQARQRPIERGTPCLATQEHELLVLHPATSKAPERHDRKGGSLACDDWNMHNFSILVLRTSSSTIEEKRLHTLILVESTGCYCCSKEIGLAGDEFTHIGIQGSASGLAGAVMNGR
jgi:hypothetical protein